MNPGSDANGLGQKVRMLALALLLSVVVLPVLVWCQSGIASAYHAPVQKVATSRFDLPPGPAASAPALGDPGSAQGPADLAVTVAAAPAPAEPAPRPAAESSQVTSSEKAGQVPITNAGGSKPAPARVETPPDPFVPEPAPTGWQSVALGDAGFPAGNPTPGENLTPFRDPSTAAHAAAPQAPARAPQPAAAPARVAGAPAVLTAPKMASARASVLAAPARQIPRPGAQRPAAAPTAAQPPAEPASVPPPTPLVDVRLRGIIRGTPDLALILVDGQTYFLKAGDAVTGAWEVGEIKDNSVVLRSGDHVRELQIEGGSQT